MKGDFVKVTYRTGVGTAEAEIVADRDGSSVEVVMPDRNGTFVIVEQLNKAKVATQTARFAAGEVVAILEGHRTITRAGIRTSKK